MRTRPRSTAIIDGPVSPFWKIVCAAAARGVRRRLQDAVQLGRTHRLEQRAGEQRRPLRIAIKPGHDLSRLPMPNPCSLRRLGVSRGAVCASCAPWDPERATHGDSCARWSRRCASPRRTRRRGRAICAVISRAVFSSGRRTTRFWGRSARAAGRTGWSCIGARRGSWGDTRQVDFTFSVAKSYLSLLAGVAVADGLIGDLDEEVRRRCADGGFEGRA